MRPERIALASATCLLLLLLLVAGATAEASERPRPRRTVPRGRYRVCTIPVEGGMLWIALRDRQVTAAHVVVDQRGFYELDASGLTLKGDRLAGELSGRYYHDVRARPGKTGTFPVDCTLAGDRAAGKTPGTIRTHEDLARAHAIAEGKAWPFWYGPTSDFRGAPGGHELVGDLNQARLVWVSEAKLRHPIVWVPTGYGGFSSPVVGGGKVFFNQFRASGDATYENRTDAPAERIDGEMRKVIGADDEVYCLDARTGELLWKQVFPGAAINQPLKDKHCMFNKTGCYRDGKVYMMGFLWRLYCMDAETGELIWRGDIGQAHADAVRQKQAMIEKGELRNLSGGANSYLAIADGVLFVNNHKGGTDGYDASSGRLLWTVPGAPTRWAHRGREYVLTRAGDTLRCIEPASGKELWRADVGSAGWSRSLLLTGDCLLSQTGDPKEAKTLGWKLSPQGATKLWEKDIGYSRPSGGVHCGDGESFYIRFSFRSGEPTSRHHPLVRIVAATGEVAAVNNNVPSGGWHGMQWFCDGRLLSSRDTCHGFGYLRMFAPETLERMGEKYVSQGGSGYDVPMTYPYVDGRLFLRGMYRIYCYDLRARSNVSTRSGAGPLKVTFQALPWKGDAREVRFQWDFGDGASGHGAKVSHTYSAPEGLRATHQPTLSVVQAGRRRAYPATPITVCRMLHAVDAGRTQPGLSVKVYEDDFRNLPDLSRMTPVATVAAEQLSTGPGRREEMFALQFEGYLEAPRAGLYRFSLDSDDVSRLWVDGHLAAQRGEPGLVGLEAGKHRIRLDYVQYRYGKHLRLLWTGPGIGTPQAVPARRLSRPR